MTEEDKVQIALGIKHKCSKCSNIVGIIIEVKPHPRWTNVEPDKICVECFISEKQNLDYIFRRKEYKYKPRRASTDGSGNNENL